MTLTEKELIALLRSAKTGAHHIGDGWTADQVVTLWEQHVSRRDRKRFQVAVWPTQVCITLRREYDRPPLRRPTAGDLTFGICCGLAAMIWASFTLQTAPEHVQEDPAPQCWTWDRDNHTLSVANTLEQFETAHEAYRRTGRAPDNLEDCSK